MPRPLLAQVVVSAAFAAWLGVGYRVLAAGVIGANIGGGGVWLLSPPLAVLTLALVAGPSIRSSRRSKRAGVPHG